MTTQQAFQMLVESPYLWMKTGASQNARRVYRHRIQRGSWPSIDKMEQLMASVFEVEQPKTWKLL